MIKLIATDVDGTLVKDSSKEIYDEYADVIRRLTDKGIYFMVASGRQYGSIRKMFEKTERDLLYIAENGAHIVVNGKTLSMTRMNRNDVEEIMADLRSYYKEGCHVVASTGNGCLLESKDDSFIRLMSEEYRNDVRLTEDILGENEDIIKLAIYKKGGIRHIGEQVLIPKWKDRVKTCMAGEEWVDFMDFSVDKGNALKIVQKELGIWKEETMAFGDNNNDIGLLRAAGESYAVENAVQELKAEAKHICKAYDKKGVYQVLNTLI